MQANMHNLTYIHIHIHAPILLYLHAFQLGSDTYLAHNQIYTHIQAHTHSYLDMLIEQTLKCQCRKYSLILREKENVSTFLLINELNPSLYKKSFVLFNKTKLTLLKNNGSVPRKGEICLLFWLSLSLQLLPCLFFSLHSPYCTLLLLLP